MIPSDDDLILQIRPGMDLIMGSLMQVPGGTVWTSWTVFESGRERF